MKQINTYITEKLHLNKGLQSSTIDYDELLEYLNNWLDGDDFPEDHTWSKKCTGWEALEGPAGDIYNLIEFVNGWSEIANDLDIDEDELYDFISDKYKEITADLLKSNK